MFPAIARSITRPPNAFITVYSITWLHTRQLFKPFAYRMVLQYHKRQLPFPAATGSVPPCLVPQPEISIIKTQRYRFSQEEVINNINVRIVRQIVGCDLCCTPLALDRIQIL